MTKRRLFLIDEQTAINIIKSYYHGNWERMYKVLGIVDADSMSEGDLDETIKRLSDKEIEQILANMEY